MIEANENTSHVRTCWTQLGSSNGLESAGQKAAVSILVLVAVCNILTSAWSVITTLAIVKLRKPTWIFKASMAIKDILLSSTMTIYVLWRVLSEPSSIQARLFNKESFFDPVPFIFNVIFLVCLSSSFVHVLLITFDRHQVISRPFRYHTGELLPPSVAIVLVVSGWTSSFVIGLSITSQALETAEKEGNLYYSGSLFPLYQMPSTQKWLMGGGMLLIYFFSVGLLCSAFSVVWSRAKKRKAQLISGEGDPEPVRSRNNSVCHSSVKRKDNPVLQLGSNPEADANEFLLTAGGLVQDQSRKEECNEEATIFTPVHYRPSLRRRIRDTWSLYSAMICFVLFSFLAAIPFLFIVLEKPELIKDEDEDNNVTSAYCIGIMICEYLIMFQGFAYVTVYLLIDDVFRPYFLQPFLKLQCRRQNHPARVKKSGRSTSSNRNGNQVV